MSDNMEWIVPSPITRHSDSCMNSKLPIKNLALKSDRFIMFKIKYLLILSMLASCSTYKLSELEKSSSIQAERSIAANPADCYQLISLFIAGTKKFDSELFTI